MPALRSDDRRPRGLTSNQTAVPVDRASPAPTRESPEKIEDESHFQVTSPTPALLRGKTMARILPFARECPKLRLPPPGC